MFDTPVLVFDIETTPDIATGKRLYQLEHLEDEDALKILESIRYQENQSSFLRLPCHQVVCISGLWIDGKNMRLFSLTQEKDIEAELLQKFFTVFNKHTPSLVSWNGSGFDLPVLTLRALKHQLSVPRLFDQGEHDTQFKYNNYQNRYHTRHTDLMDALAHFNQRNFHRLDDVAGLLNLPGKAGSNGLMVKDWVQAEQWQTVAEYCESDVLNTWFIFLHWLKLKGTLDDMLFKDWQTRTIELLTENHLNHPFLHGWQQLQSK